jgi:lysophospholipase L1-like esterase
MGARRRGLLGLMLGCALLAAWAAPGDAAAQGGGSFAGHTRYLALGDSLSAGYGALPATQGFTYQLYQAGVIDGVGQTLFANAAVPGALSEDVLLHQVPQAARFFQNTGVPYPKLVTLTVGGNDLLALLGPAPGDPAVVLGALANNLFGILATLLAQYPDVQVFVGNLYDPGLPIPGASQLILAANQAIAQVVSLFPPQSVILVDLHAAFAARAGLLLVERHGADPLEVHPTNAGHRVMEQAFAGAIRR